jgi:hypothetical protein
VTAETDSAFEFAPCNRHSARAVDAEPAPRGHDQPTNSAERHPSRHSGPRGGGGGRLLAPPPPRATRADSTSRADPSNAQAALCRTSMTSASYYASSSNDTIPLNDATKPSAKPPVRLGKRRGLYVACPRHGDGGVCGSRPAQRERTRDRSCTSPHLPRRPESAKESFRRGP